MPDRAGFEAFYAAHLPRVVRACALVLLDRGDAEDVAAEAFGRLWSHWGQIHGEDHAGGYVFKTAMRLCSKRRRRAAREVVGTVPERSEVGRSRGPHVRGRCAPRAPAPAATVRRAPRLGRVRDEGGREDARHEGEHGAGASGPRSGSAPRRADGGGARAMNDVRDEALGAVLDREAARIESTPVDRLPEVLRRGSRMRAIRFTAIAAAVAVFVGAVSWAGLQNEGRGTIPANIDDWDTFASLEENGWTIQVPPPWQVQELPACPNAPERIGVIVTNVDFEFLNPRGETPECEDRFLFRRIPGRWGGVRVQAGRDPIRLLPSTVRHRAPARARTLSPAEQGRREVPAASFIGIWAQAIEPRLRSPMGRTRGVAARRRGP